MNDQFVFGFGFLLLVLVIYKSGKSFPLIYLFFLIFYVQYVLATYLIYTDYKQLSVLMPIPMDELFSYLLPSLFSLFLGVYIFKKDTDDRELTKRIDPVNAMRLGYLLVFVSYSFDLVELKGVTSLNSIFSFTRYLKFIGAFCFLFSGSFFSYLIVACVYMQLVLSSFANGLFIDLIVWGMFLFFFVTIKFKLSILVKSIIIVSAVPFLILVQSAKKEYRKATWYTRSKSADPSAALYTDLIAKNVENQDLFDSNSKVFRSTIGRLNQGWHLGLALRHVPLKKPFANGMEMLTDVTSSLLPRVLYPSKKVVHTKEKFAYYTGFKIKGGTSMTIGILGDFYINFGREGSIIALFIFGALISRFLNFFKRKFVSDKPINIVWIPFIMMYFVQADNEFYSLLNAIIKGFFIFLIINYVWEKYFELKTEGAEFEKSLEK